MLRSSFHHEEFKLMQHSSLQVYSKKLFRVVFMYHKITKTCRRFKDNFGLVEEENQEELKRLLELMRRTMVLEDLADV